MTRGGVQPGSPLLELLIAEINGFIAVYDEHGRYLYVNSALAERHNLPAPDHIGRSVAEVVSQEAQASVLSLIAKTSGGGDPLHGTRLESEGRVLRISCFPLALPGQLAVAHVGMDVTDLEVAMAHAHAAAAQQAALSEFSRSAALATELEQLLAEALALLISEFDADLAEVVELIPGEQFVLRASSGYQQPTNTPMTIPAGSASQAGYTLDADGPVVVKDLAAEARFTPSALIVNDGVRSGITVPITVDTRSWGVLGVHSRTPGMFVQEDVSVVATVANILGAAIARESSVVELRRLALQRHRLIKAAMESGERERRRLAEVLHDDVLQHLLFARQECASAPGIKTEPALSRARDSLDTATKLLRTVVGDLHPITLAHVGLGATVDSLAHQYAEIGGFRTVVAVGQDLPSSHDQLVASAVRELLANAVKHSNAMFVDVQVRAGEGELLVEVSDDGVGFDPGAVTQAVKNGHVGLASLVERVEATGGRVELGARLDGLGARVRLMLPVS